MEFLRSLDTCSFFPEHFIGARHLGLFLLTSEKLVFVKKCIGLKHHLFSWNEVQFNSIAHACPTLCNPMDCSTSGFPVHQLLELAQTHVHWVSDAIQASHPLSSSSPFAFVFFPASGSFPMSQLFTSGGQSIEASASVLLMNTRGWFPLGLTGLIST